MRRFGLVVVLIPAVLAAAVGLAAYSYQRSRTERELIMDMLVELAEEKVLGVESEILKYERAVIDDFEFDKRYELEQVLATTPFTSAFILDFDQIIVPTGSYSKHEGAESFRTLFENEILKELNLESVPLGQRRHHHGQFAGRPMLFSFVRLFEGGQVYFLVLEVDLSYLVGTVFPQFFGVRSNQLYQIVDERGQVVYGYPFSGVSPADTVELGFPKTLSGWRLRVTQRDRLALADYETRQLIDASLIGAALVIIFVGVWVLLAAIRRERRLSRLKSDFISNVSHELKTPLSIISMFGELLATGRTKSTDQAREYAEIIQRESIRLGRLIDNVLDFSKIERGAEAYDFAPGNLIDVVLRALEISKHRLTQAKFKLEVEMPETIDDQPMDSNALVLAVLNLVDNAIKYAAAGGRLAVAVSREDRRTVVSVRDWGPGIEEDEHDSIFERFYRARSVRLKPIRGSGIGLALVRHIARAHGGGVSAESPPNGGARFVMWIPSPPPE